MKRSANISQTNSPCNNNLQLFSRPSRLRKVPPIHGWKGIAGFHFVPAISSMKPYEILKLAPSAKFLTFFPEHPAFGAGKTEDVRLRRPASAFLSAHFRVDSRHSR